MADDDGIYDFYDNDENLAVAGPPVAPSRKAKLLSHLPIRFSAEVLTAARAFAVEDGMSISSWIRRLVEREVMRRTPAETGSSTVGWQFDLPLPAVATGNPALADV